VEIELNRIDFADASAETTSLNANTDAGSTDWNAEDSILLLSSQTYRGIAAATGVAELIRQQIILRNWPSDRAVWRLASCTRLDVINDVLDAGRGGVLVVDGLTMRSAGSYAHARAALGTLAALLLVHLHTTSDLRIQVHLNGGFKAMLPSLLTAVGATISLLDHRTTRISGVALPKVEGMGTRLERFTVPLGHLGDLYELRDPLFTGDCARISDWVAAENARQAQSGPARGAMSNVSVQPELLALIDALCPPDCDNGERHLSKWGVKLVTPNAGPVHDPGGN